MPDPRFEPRSYLREPGRFGRDPEAQWVSAVSFSSGQLDQWGAARIQHRLACSIRVEMARQFRSVGTYAAASGQSPERLGRLLRGEVVMRLEDVANARRHLGV